VRLKSCQESSLQRSAEWRFVKGGGVGLSQIAADEGERGRKRISVPHFPFPTVFAARDVSGPQFGVGRTPRRAEKRRFEWVGGCQLFFLGARSLAPPFESIECRFNVGDGGAFGDPWK
jgi:hypothetical protein